MIKHLHYLHLSVDLLQIHSIQLRFVNDFYCHLQPNSKSEIKTLPQIYQQQVGTTEDTQKCFKKTKNLIGSLMISISGAKVVHLNSTDAKVVFEKKN